MININNFLISKLLGIVFVCIFMSVYARDVHGQDKEHALNIGLVYPLSTQGVHSKEYVNIFSLHALMGISRGEKAFAVAGFSNIIREDATGFQTAGFYNQIGGDAIGFIAAGFINRYNHADGVQLAGFLNLAGGDMKGTQVAGFLNKASYVEGVQVAGFLNKAGKVRGVQLAGFINIADSSDYPLALVNIIGNGERWLGVIVDDNLSTIVSFRSGSRKVYGIVGAGYNLNNADKLIAIQYGLGAHLFYDRKLHVNTEATVNHLTGGGTGMLFKSSLSVLAALRVSQKVEIFAGPSFNYVNVTSDTDRDMVDDYIWHHGKAESAGRMYGLYVGYTAGIHFMLR